MDKANIKTGQIWREVDPRFNRFVRVVSVAMTRRGVGIRTVVPESGEWKDAPNSRISYADHTRFNSKRGGYELREEPAQ